MSQSCPLTSNSLHDSTCTKHTSKRMDKVVETSKKNIATTLSPQFFSELLCHIHGKGGLNQKLPKIPCPPGRIPSACGRGPGSNVSGVIPFPAPVSLINTLTPCSVLQFPFLDHLTLLGRIRQGNGSFHYQLGRQLNKRWDWLSSFPPAWKLRRLSDISMQA